MRRTTREKEEDRRLVYTVRGQLEERERERERERETREQGEKGKKTIMGEIIRAEN